MDEDFESLVQVYRIVEKKDGAVFKTELIENRWVPFGATAPEGFTFAPMPNSYHGQTMRRKPK